MTKYIIDAYAWIEYFEGSSQGKKVRDMLSGEHEILTHAVTVAEVVSRMKRKSFDGEAAFGALQGLSQIIPATADFSQEVGLAHAETRAKVPGFGLADAFVLVLARKAGGKIVTGDPHFQQEKGVVFLG